MNYFYALLLVVTVLSCNAPLRNDHTIVPGDGIGPYRLGITSRAEVLADGHSLAVKNPLLLRYEFQFDEGDRLKCISVHEPGWKTSRGIGVGSSRNALLLAYPVTELKVPAFPSPHGGHTYWYPGMLVYVGSWKEKVIDDIYILPFL